MVLRPLWASETLFHEWNCYRYHNTIRIFLLSEFSSVSFRWSGSSISCLFFPVQSNHSILLIDFCLFWSKQLFPESSRTLAKSYCKEEKNIYTQDVKSRVVVCKINKYFYRKAPLLELGRGQFSNTNI